jgi:aldehyde dehydrogenase (NAD+)
VVTTTRIRDRTPTGALIGGTWTDPGATLPDIDPSTGEELARIAACGPAEIQAAIGAATDAAPRWRALPVADRAAILERLAGLIRERQASLAEVESLDTGKPLRQARTDIAVCARYFEYYARTCEAVFGDTIPISDGLLAYSLREPHGVTGHIIPWNYPAQITARTIAPALATGNTCVLKPAEEAPLTPLLLAEAALEAGLPAGVFNVVPGTGEDAGAALAAHPGVDHLSFTGSPEVGRAVARAAAETITPVTLELGGKSPHIVFADADLERATPTIVNSILQNAGQTCSAGSRVLVERGLQERLVAHLRERFTAVRIGRGLDDPELGPLISAKQLERVRSYVERAAGDARLVTGGTPPNEDDLRGGYFFCPTLFDDVPPEAPLAREEVFGPVLAVTPFDDEAEAVALANGTDYGLIAAVWTRDVARAHRVARTVQAGQIYVNGYGAGGGVELPFGGVKHSGFGREKGFEALLGYTRTKAVAIRIDD